jgi:hypothetical protein
MAKRVLAPGLGIALVLLTAGCGEGNESDGKISMPSSASVLEGQNYEEVIADLEKAGFRNVEAKPLGNLITGWLNDEGEVEEVAVDGSTSFSGDDRYAKDVEIIVSYHSFPVETSDETASPEATSTAEVATSPSDPSEKAEEENLTVKNNKDLAALLAGPEPDTETIEGFAAKYEGRTIEFDGNIAYMNNHGDYATRYDLLIHSGDYSETATMGPNFQFRDVNMLDLNLTGDDVPDYLGTGDNVHIVAKVEEYNVTQNLFQLEPVSTAMR